MPRKVLAPLMILGALVHGGAEPADNLPLPRPAGSPARPEREPRPEAVPGAEKAPGKAEPRPAGPPTVRLLLGQRNGVTDSGKNGVGHIAGGFIEVTQPRPDAVVVRITGLTAVAGTPCQDSLASLDYHLTQHFRIAVSPPGPCLVRLTAEAQLVGLLRGSREGPGVAAVAVPASAAVETHGAPVLHVGFPEQSHSGPTNHFISDRLEPVTVEVPPGDYTLAEQFGIRCTHPKRAVHKNVVIAAFGINSPRAPEWMNQLDPYRDLPRVNEVGFIVTLHAEPIPEGVGPGQLPAPPARTLPGPGRLPAPAPVKE